jgi:hypothetical protein
MSESHRGPGSKGPAAEGAAASATGSSEILRGSACAHTQNTARSKQGNDTIAKGERYIMRNGEECREISLSGRRNKSEREWWI